MRTDQHQEKKIAIMEKCFACYAKNGLTGTGVKALAEACGCTQGNLYSYFKNLDELIVESTAYCMSRYTAYAKELEPKLGIPYTVITPLIFIFVRACVHYAMFEDEYYLKSQMEVLKTGVSMFMDTYRNNLLREV